MNPLVYYPSRFLSWAFVKLLFLYSVRGRAHEPREGPLLLVGNHASFLDPLLLGLAVRRQARFIARSTLATRKTASWWLRNVGTLLIDRDAPSHKVLDTAIEHLERGEAIALFPEGTRTRTGEVAEFKRGLLLMVKKTSATVLPIGISGSFAAWPRGRRLPRWFRRCRASVGEAMSAAELLREGGLEELRRRVAALAGVPLAAPGKPLAQNPHSSAPDGGILPPAGATQDQRPDGPAAMSNRDLPNGARSTG